MRCFISNSRKSAEYLFKDISSRLEAHLKELKPENFHAPSISADDFFKDPTEGKAENEADKKNNLADDVLTIRIQTVKHLQNKIKSYQVPRTMAMLKEFYDSLNSSLEGANKNFLQDSRSSNFFATKQDTYTILSTIRRSLYSVLVNQQSSHEAKPLNKFNKL